MLVLAYVESRPYTFDFPMRGKMQSCPLNQNPLSHN